MSPAPRRRPAIALALLVAAALAVGGCGVTKSSLSCENADCEVTLSGSGAEADLDSQGITIVLEGVSDGAAQLQVLGGARGPDAAIELAAGEDAEVLGLTLSVETISGEEVTLRSRPS